MNSHLLSFTDSPWYDKTCLFLNTLYRKQFRVVSVVDELGIKIFMYCIWRNLPRLYVASQSKSVAKLSCRLECVVVASLSQKIAQKVYERHNKNSTLYRLNCKQKRHMSCKVLSNFMQMKYMYNTYTRIDTTLIYWSCYTTAHIIHNAFRVSVFVLSFSLLKYSRRFFLKIYLRREVKMNCNE